MESKISIYDALADREAWRAVLAALPPALADVYFTPEYVSLHHGEDGGRTQLWEYHSAGQRWLNAFLIRPVPGVDGARWRDLETPYGYGGPLATTDDPVFLAEAHAAYDEWCESHGVIAEFTRFHPLLQNQRWASPGMQVLFDRPTISMQLRENGAPVYVPTSHSGYQRRRIEKQGVAISVREPAQEFDSFVEIYRKAMKALGADAYFLFHGPYFDRLRELVVSRGSLVVATKEETWVAASLFLRGERCMHYHLAGTNPEMRVGGAAHVILVEAAVMARDAGFDALHLGGGRSPAPDDSLLEFKRSMGTVEHHYYIGRRVFLPEAYDRVKSAWATSHPGLVERFGNRLLCYRFLTAMDASESFS